MKSHPNEDQRWDNLRRRETPAENPFIYAVRTTGIYCRPGCSSRLPRRDNVRFFDSSLEAEQAGFRACKKCNPRSPLLNDRRVSVVRQACRYIETSETPPSLNQLAKKVNLSSSQFHRLFKELIGATPKQYADTIQAIRVRESLEAGQSVTQAVHAAGFGSSSRFYEKWAWILGMKPQAYGSSGLGELIVYSTVESPLGWMNVAATRLGVCSISFGDRSADLEENLREKFRHASVIAGDDDFRDWVWQVAARIETHKAFQNLPLDIQGTAFMRRVWSELRNIPLGETRTYSQIAETIGKPSATRAVANACAKNSLAIAIPCHRVIRNDGKMGGYRWGIQRKKKLLEDEAP